MVGVFLIEMGRGLVLIARQAGIDSDNCTILILSVTQVLFVQLACKKLCKKKKLSQFPNLHVCLGLLLTQDNAL
jgi:hypothetical protein